MTSSPLSLAATSLLISVACVNAFTLQGSSFQNNVAYSNSVDVVRSVAFVDSSVSFSRRRNYVTLSMSGEEETEAVSEEVTAEETAEEAVVEEDETEEKEEEPKEDPEITALKDEIAVLEIELKSNRVKLSNTQDLADDYTDGGYRRKCAEMDNMRRLRSQASATNQVASKANILKTFLPTLDTLKILEAKYADNEFASGYGAIPRDFENCLKGLDVTEFTVEVGSKIDLMRCVAISEEFSESDEAGVIMRVEKDGFEVQGNVIRFAEVVSSLGSEKKDETEEAAAEEEK